MTEKVYKRDDKKISYFLSASPLEIQDLLQNAEESTKVGAVGVFNATERAKRLLKLQLSTSRILASNLAEEIQIKEESSDVLHENLFLGFEALENFSLRPLTQHSRNRDYYIGLSTKEGRKVNRYLTELENRLLDVYKPYFTSEEWKLLSHEEKLEELIRPIEPEEAMIIRATLETSENLAHLLITDTVFDTHATLPHASSAYSHHMGSSVAFYRIAYRHNVNYWRNRGVDISVLTSRYFKLLEEKHIQSKEIRRRLDGLMDRKARTYKLAPPEEITGVRQLPNSVEVNEDTLNVFGTFSPPLSLNHGTTADLVLFKLYKEWQAMTTNLLLCAIFLFGDMTEEERLKLKQSFNQTTTEF